MLLIIVLFLVHSTVPFQGKIQEKQCQRSTEGKGKNAQRKLNISPKNCHHRAKIAARGENRFYLPAKANLPVTLSHHFLFMQIYKIFMSISNRNIHKQYT